MKYIFYCILFLFFGIVGMQAKEVRIKLIETSDIHGSFFPYDFLINKDAPGSLARVQSYVKEKRKAYGENLILVDNGDILQGQPTAYYYNHMDTISTHLCADMMNYMEFDVGNMGNHDLETGRSVFERWIRECNFPVLGANIIDVSTEQPFLKPYEVIERDGVKIVILGMITPAIPVWLSENLWRGLRFDDMEKTARKWMRIIRKVENPDMVVGLFHAGQYEKIMGGKYKDNASLTVARNIPGFDIVLMGHDHLHECKKIINVEGDTVLVVNPGSDGIVVADIDITLTIENGRILRKAITGQLVSTDQYNPDKEFMDHFQPQYNAIKDFLAEKIGCFEESMSTRDAFFGPSIFVDFIHKLQLDISKADISFTAPLAYDAQIQKGEVTVADMFTLYRYENMLYTVGMTGLEIKNYLEASYKIWTGRMKKANDHLLNLKKEKKRNTGFNPLKYYSYNFDSAAGIIYTVDVTKKDGKKINIISMADGSPFEYEKTYTVALNSYRGTGGGELLTKGAGIAHGKILDRIINSTDKDLRYYLIKYIEKEKIINPQPLWQWKFIPEKWTIPAAKRDYEILFTLKGEK